MGNHTAHRYLKRKLRDFNSTYLEHSHCQRAISCSKLQFFVYSPKDQMHIKMQRNKNALRAIIPNIQWFYVKYFVQYI
jgi:hypothetical protein